MPAPLGPLFGFSIGVLLAWISRSYSDADAPRVRPRPKIVVVLFAGLIFAPVCGYFIAFAGDWSLAYLIDSRRIPSAIDLLLIVADAASVLGGFEVARSLSRRRPLRTITALASAPLVPALLFVLMFYGRLRIEGSFHQVQSDFGTQPIAGGPLGYALLWMDAILAAGLAFTARILLERRRPPTAAAPPREPLPSGPGPTPADPFGRIER